MGWAARKKGTARGSWSRRQPKWQFKGCIVLRVVLRFRGARYCHPYHIPVHQCISASVHQCTSAILVTVSKKYENRNDASYTLKLCTKNKTRNTEEHTAMAEQENNDKINDETIIVDPTTLKHSSGERPGCLKQGPSSRLPAQAVQTGLKIVVAYASTTAASTAAAATDSLSNLAFWHRRGLQALWCVAELYSSVSVSPLNNISNKQMRMPESLGNVRLGSGRHQSLREPARQPRRLLLQHQHPWRRQ